jgi:hypothetical protein
MQWYVSSGEKARWTHEMPRRVAAYVEFQIAACVRLAFSPEATYKSISRLLFATVMSI